MKDVIMLGIGIVIGAVIAKKTDDNARLKEENERLKNRPQ